MRYEQYGSGPWNVQTVDDDGVGNYRFKTEAEAVAFQEKNGGKISREKRPLGNVHEAAAQRHASQDRPNCS